MEPLAALIALLTYLHARDQETVADNLVLALYPLWQIMNFEDLDETSVLWIQSALPAIRTAFLQSQRLTVVYMTNVRFAALAAEEPFPVDVPDVERPAGVPAARFRLPRFSAPGTPEPAVNAVLEEFPEADVATSLAIEGNFNVKAQMPGPQEELMQAGLVNSTGASVRHAMHGGRSAAKNVIRMDRRVIGYARYTDANPCYFCALLASRGAVYKKNSFAEVDREFVPNRQAPKVPDDYIRVAKVHNHCRCTLRPVYSRSQEWDEESLFYRRQWERFVENEGRGLAGKAQIAAWRKVYKPFQRGEAPASVTDIREELNRRRVALGQEGFAADSPQVQWVESAHELLA